MSDREPDELEETGGRGGLVVVAMLGASVLAAVVGAQVLARVGPTGKKAQLALMAGNKQQARELAVTAARMRGDDDVEALAVLDALDAEDVRALPTPMARAERAVATTWRTRAGRTDAEAIVRADAEAAVAEHDAPAIEDLRAAAHGFGPAFERELVVRRELVVIGQCVRATQMLCASLFPPADKRHEAVKARLDELQRQQAAQALAVFREADMLIASKPEARVAGAAFHDKLASAEEHMTLARPEERDATIAAFYATHTPEALRERAERERRAPTK
jgi:hypothetical protein